MKNNKSSILKGLLFSGVILASFGISTNVAQAADTSNTSTTTSADTKTAKVTNSIIFESGGTEIGTSAPTVTGAKVGDSVDISKIIPSGYQVADGSTSVKLQANGTSQAVKLTKIATVTARVHYIYNSGVVGTEELTGAAGSTVAVSNVPAGYFLTNKNTGNVILGSGTSDVYLDVTHEISNSVRFVLDDTAKTEVGSTTIVGEKAGDKVTMTSDQIPSGYALKNAADMTVTLQPDTNRQQVTVAAVSTTEDSKGTIATKNSTAPLYSENGAKLGSRALGANSDWATDKKLSLSGQTYYRVSTSEWASAGDVYVYTSNPTTVTAKSGSIRYLYDIDGKKIETRAVAGGSAWYSDRTTMINGQKYYRVSTSEWLSAEDVQ
ncbi:SLAP domain-containing protein [Companilactobacillus mishanensis]|uniref:S-layer protein C-terminal domain-containing protein n=1 Tax=Companilactobacillus mishanensis TaxID=2486008 RepID=A0A5P0ZIA8_9LACO|nr:SLAP domain-containing protein [Companilactobacillus mishanensis]MQS52799.1 hypothetical protein [Companilactobacillus mishanensis]